MPYAKTRWWHANKYTPVPTQTVNWLKSKNLIPLHSDNEKLPLIAKVLGTTFGDGGIFANLNGIFLSSSELEAVKEFGEDLKLIFGNEIDSNSRIIEAGVYSHSWCYQNTNRNIIRLFQALGAPIGRKSNFNTEVKVSEWIFLSNKTIQDEFFGSIFGGELGTPTIHKEQNRLTSLDIGMQIVFNKREKAENYLNQIASYLNSKGIKTGSIYSYLPDNESILLRLQISTQIENYYNFTKNIKLNYCKYKCLKLKDALTKFIEIKRKKYNELLVRGYNKDHILKLFNVSENFSGFLNLISLPEVKEFPEKSQ